jgi:hypothetical protein
MWEANKGHTDPSKSYEELLAKVKDFSRKRKLDSSAKEKRQHGGDPMDVGAVGGWNCNDDTGGGYDQGDGVYAFGFEGKGKSKGKGTVTIADRPGINPTSEVNVPERMWGTPLPRVLPGTAGRPGHRSPERCPERVFLKSAQTQTIPELRF